MQETQKTQVQSLGQEDLLQKEMAIYSSILVWETPRTEEPGKLWRVRHDCMTEHTQVFSPCDVCLVPQSCLALCDPMDSSLPGSSAHGDSPGKNTRVGCHGLLQGIFPTQGLNSGLLHYRWILYHLRHQGNRYLNQVLWTWGKDGRRWGMGMSKSPLMSINKQNILYIC